MLLAERLTFIDVCCCCSSDPHSRSENNDSDLTIAMVIALPSQRRLRSYYNFFIKTPHTPMMTHLESIHAQVIRLIHCCTGLTVAQLFVFTTTAAGGIDLPIGYYSIFLRRRYDNGTEKHRFTLWLHCGHKSSLKIGPGLIYEALQHRGASFVASQ